MTAIKSGDPVLNTMRFKGIPVTRKNYLNLCYMGKPPLDSDGHLHPEAEQELPDELRGPDDVIGQSNPINALLADYPLCDYPLMEFYRILSVLMEGK